MKLHRALFLAVAFASATASAQPDKQAPAEVTPSDAKAWVALFDQIVDTVVANRESCPKMASGIHTLVDTNQPTIAIARDAKAKGKRLPAAAMRAMAEGAQRMIAALDKCGRDESVADAFKRLDLGGRK